MDRPVPEDYPCFAYVLECSDGTYYSGWTTDMERRLAAHNAGRASRYTRSRLPVRLVYKKGFENRSGAMRHEAWLKSLSRGQKESLLSGPPAKTSGGT